ncbi:hypothetical protein, partial [Rhizobium sp. L245/93]|uniref:hypothetical protein n=1 Tax=Rhizobium sp. L245/93 TaxID=2819998 RepID=UPI001ADC2A00
RRQSPQKRRGFSCKVETPIAKEKLNLRSSANAYSRTAKASSKPTFCGTDRIFDHCPSRFYPFNR